MVEIRNNCNLSFLDFKKAIEFGTSFYIDPQKNTTGRTTSEPRGLGSILDSFTIGKLTEIGVGKIFHENNKNKNYKLDFDIKTNRDVMNEPDIIGIVASDDKIAREPNCFIEVKNLSDNVRWIGLTEEQFSTICRASNNKKIYFIYASISSKAIDNNSRTTDLVGMFLKDIEDVKKSQVFQDFAKLNAHCVIRYIIPSDCFKKYATAFDKGMNFYETNLFLEVKKNTVYCRDGKRKDILNSKEYEKYDGIINVKIAGDVVEPQKNISDFSVTGSFILHFKKKKAIIECISDVKLSNNVFGDFFLKASNFYDFNLVTIGRDPKLKRNNLFISKNKLDNLIKNGKIKSIKDLIAEIVNSI